MAKKQITLDIPEKIKILGISASPRKAGNTSEMVKFTLKAAESMGYVETEYISLANYHFGYCVDCKRCAGYNKPADDPIMCYHDPEDQQWVIHDKTAEADGVLLGLPSYTGHEPALLRMAQEHTYCGGSPFFNELEPGKRAAQGRNKPFGIISQGGQPMVGWTEQWSARAVEAGPGSSGFRVGAWPTVEDPQPLSSYLGPMLSCQDGVSVYAKDAWTSGASRITPPLTGTMQERTLRNVGRWLAMTTITMKLAQTAFREAGFKEPQAQLFNRYAGGKPKPGTIIDKLIKEGKVTYVPPEEIESRKRLRA